MASASAAALTSPLIPHVLFVLGGPGAGKGTQCARLVADFGFVHLSAGDLLRAERAAGGPTADMINEYIKEGKIVPVETTIELIRKAMVQSGATRFLVDGFPRNENNLDGWLRVMGNGAAAIDGVLVYDCPEAVMEARLLERGKTSGRTDDNLESIKKRFATHVRETTPVIDFFRARGQVHEITADRPVEEVYAQTRAAVEPLLLAGALEANQALLAAVHAADWPAYEALCSPELTAIEPESDGAVVTGLPFHKVFFDAARAPGAPRKAPSRSVMEGVSARLAGPRTAVLAYLRVVEREGGARVPVSETRVWEFVAPGRWVNTHFHRSPVPAPPAAAAPPAEQSLSQTNVKWIAGGAVAVAAVGLASLAIAGRLARM